MGEQAFPWTVRDRLARPYQLPWCLLGFTHQLLVHQIRCRSSQSRDLANAGMKGVGGLEPPTTEAPQEPQHFLTARLASQPAWRQAADSAGSTVYDRAARVVSTVVAKLKPRVYLLACND